MVDWWQLDRSELVDSGLVPFNHGERVYRRWGDQVRRAAHLLSNSRADSSRGIMQLVAPRETGRYPRDERDLGGGSFPCFVLAELGFAVTTASATSIASAISGSRSWGTGGPSTSPNSPASKRPFAAHQRHDQAPAWPDRDVLSDRLWADRLPNVAVPEIDRLVDKPERLWALAAAIANPDGCDQRTRAEWRMILADLTGEGRTGPPQPKLGLRRLAEELDRVNSVASSSSLRRVRARLQALETQHASHADGELNETAVGLVLDAARGLREAVDRALRPSASS